MPFADAAKFKFAPTLTEKFALSGLDVPTCKLFEDAGMALSLGGACGERDAFE